jgi:hypothetical protein
MKTFENYLQDRHAAQYGGLDDEMGEDFDDWLEDMDKQDLIAWGNMYGAAQRAEGMEYMAQKYNDCL